MNEMPVKRIEYDSWEGKKSGRFRRIYVIIKKIFRDKMSSKGILLLLILGIILGHALPIMSRALTPHESLTAEMMVGKSLEESHLFSIPEMGMSENLNQGMIPKWLENQLSENASLSVEENNKKWRIVDADEEYIIKRENDKLKIYGEPKEGYLTNGLFVLFSLILSAIICSDLISIDLQDNSFVLYFSRPIRTEDYILGKIGGAFSVIGIFSLLPPIIFSLAVTATQSGGSYLSSFGVLGATVVVGILTTFVFASFGVMISSLTSKRSYAGVGAFASFFILGIVGGIFSEFDPNWQVVNPLNLLNYFYELIYGFDLPSGVDAFSFGLAFLSLLVIPITVLYYRIQIKA